MVTKMNKTDNETSKLVKTYKKLNYNGSLLRTSLRYQTAQFFENSTLHGVRYIAENGRPLLEKFMWFCCVSIGAVATVIIIVDLWEKFQTNPTITGLDTDFHSWDVPFPALTLCDIDEYQKETSTNETNDAAQYLDGFIESTWPNDPNNELKKEFLISLSRLNYNTMKNFSKYIENPELAAITQDLKTLIFKVVKHCEDILIDCKWKNDVYNCCKEFYPIFTENGFCYTFNSREFEHKWPWQESPLLEFKLKHIQETDIKWSFEFSSTSQKMLVFIHNADEVPSIDTNPQHVWDQRVNKLSFSVKHTYTTEDARQLSIKQRHCIFEDEVKLKIDKVMYTYTACTRECRMETSKKLCGCVPFFYPAIEGFKHCSLKELSCVIKYLDQIKSVEKCNCQLGCSNTVYEVEKLNERTDSSENNLESEFVSWPMVRYKREVLFGWVDLLVSFGGIAGLFLGFSLLSGVEIIYYFTIRTCCMVYRDREEVEKLLEERKRSKKQTDIDAIPQNNYPITNNNFGNASNNFRKNIVLKKKFGDMFLRHSNLIRPVVPKKINILQKNNFMHPPFGIEFIN